MNSSRRYGPLDETHRSVEADRKHSNASPTKDEVDLHDPDAEARAMQKRAAELRARGVKNVRNELLREDQEKLERIRASNAAYDKHRAAKDERDKGGGRSR